MASDQCPQLPLKIPVPTLGNSRPDDWSQLVAHLVKIDPAHGLESNKPYYTFTDPHITLDATHSDVDIWTIHTEAAYLWWMMNAPSYP